MAKEDNELVTTLVINGKDDPSLKKAFNKADKEAEKISKKLKKLGEITSKVALTTAAAVGASVVASVHKFGMYEESLHKVGTIADTEAKSLAQLGDESLALSNKLGIASTEVNEALYQAISAGAKTEYALDLVNVSLMAAKGGFTDATVAVDGLTSVLNTYGLQTQDAMKIANQMIITQNLGKTTFDELAQSVGRVAPIAASAKIGTDELFSSIAVLTANGIQTTEAVSGLKAAISNILKPTADARNIAKKLGLDFSATALASKGLNGFLADMYKKTNGDLDAMSKLFGSVEALNAMLVLSSDKGLSLMNNSLLEMKNNTTALEDAYDQMTNTMGNKIAIAKNKISNLMIKIGGTLAPYVIKAVDKINEMNFDKLIENVKALAVLVGGMTATFVAFKAAAGITKIVKGYIALKAALEGASVAQYLLNAAMTANPIGIIIVAIGALVTAIGVLYTKCEWFRNGIKKIFGGVSKVISKVGKFLGIGKKKDDEEDEEVPSYGTGGTVDYPHLALIGDTRETIVPHGNTPRNRALLSEAARGVGATTNSQMISINYSPVIYASNQQEIKRSLDEDYTRFEQMLNTYFKREKRLSF